MSEKMKDSGVSWIGEIPEGWGVSKIKYIVGTKITDGPHETPELLDEGIPFVSAESVKNGIVNLDFKRGFISEENHKIFSRKVAPLKDDIYIVKSGATTGNIGIVETEEVFDIWSPLALIRGDKRKVVQKFLYYSLQSEVFRMQVEKKWSFGTQQNIGMGVIEQIQILLPESLEEQKKISDYLDKQTSKFDQAQKLLKDEIERLRAYKKSLIYETVTKGLDKNVQLKDSGVEWIGDIPEGWEVTKIKFSTTLNGRIGWQGLTSSEYQTEGPYLITGTDFNNGQINFETAVHIENHRWEEAKHIQIKNGDLLITKDGTVGKVAIVTNLNDKASLNSGVLKIQPMPEIYTKFLYYVLISEEFWLWFNYTNSGASTILHLYQNVFDEFSYAIPLNRRQQKAIVDYLDEKINKIDQIIEIKEQQLKKISEQRKTLIYEIVTGKKKINVG